MCGRFAIGGFGIFHKRFDTQNTIDYEDSYNIPPGSRIPVVKRNSPNTAVLMKWGLVPSWSKELKVKFSTFNARAENLEKSPVFRGPFKKKRCLIPSTGFYEWKKHDDGTKTPNYISLKSEQMFAFAGLYDIWKDAEGKEFPTCTIITTTPNSLMKPIHHRMPVILKRQDEDVWIDPASDIEHVKKLLKPYAADDMEAWPVSADVNSPRNDDKHLIDKKE